MVFHMSTATLQPQQPSNNNLIVMSNEPTIEQVLAVLNNVKARGDGGWVASCPFPDEHKDHEEPRSQSLAVDVDNGKVLVKCRNGHTNAWSVIRKLALQLKTGEVAKGPKNFE